METKNLNIEMNSKQLESCAEKLSNINENIAQIFERVKTIMDNINVNETWEGDACDAYYERYEELRDYFEKINKGIEIYSNFLKTTATNYEKVEKQIGMNIDSNSEELNVNS